MNEPEVTPSQPSAPLTAPVQTAADAAVASGDQAAFREARRAEKTPPAPKVESRSTTPARPAAPTGASTAEASEASTPTAATPSRGNAKTRLAEVDAEVTALKAKLAERDDLLRRSREPAREPARDAPTPNPKPAPPALTLPAEVASYEAYLAKHPEASLEEFFDARSDARQELRAQQQVQQQRQVAREQATAREVDTFAQRVNEAVTADPTFVERVKPEILALRPLAALPPGARVTAGNVLAQELVRSELPVKVMEELSAHPDELQRLLQAKNPGEVIRGVARIEARITGQPVEARPPFKPTQTPAPPTTLGRRPTDTLPATEAAIRDGDQAAYKVARNAERAARFSRH